MVPPLGMIRIGRLTMAETNLLSDRIEEETDALAVNLNEVDEAASEWELLAYYPDEATAREAASHLAHPQATVSAVPEMDWVRQSLEGLKPIAAGRFFLHGSHDRARRRSGGISLEIDAGTAFGTGHHPTTLGCLTALDAILKARMPRRILDVGCGTGVLALAAAKALRKRIVASDIDPEAVRVARGNARLNGLTPWLESFAVAGVGDRRITASGPYDLILANILALPLIKLAGPIAGLAGPGAQIILSGLTVSQERAVFAAYCRRGLVRQARVCGGDWVTLVLTKQNARPFERTGRVRSSRSISR